MSDEQQRGRARGKLIVVSAPSGAGKSSLVMRVLEQVEGLHYSISYTTRSPRGTEQAGVDYHFVNLDQFKEMRDRGEFLEWAEVHGHYYGTPKSTVEPHLENGEDVMLDIDVQGAELIRTRMPEAVGVFILPPSREVLEARLRRRNLNNPADLERRLRNAASEVRLYERFDYVIINDDLERASTMLEAVIVAERLRPARQKQRAAAIIETFGGESAYVG